MTDRRLEQGDEPVAGYSLDTYLGQGGFGEVWKATGPGGVPVALKIIHDLDRKKGGKELRALQLLKRIGHPNLVPLTGFWLRTSDGELIGDEQRFPSDTSEAGEAARGTMSPEALPSNTLVQTPAAQLVIAMGLCEKSLFDRLEECQREGLEGVPFDELLTYMDDAARAIDLLNTNHDIQHCDIKPQNILLLSGAAQVADFGLAKVIGDVRESSMGAGTIAYGAPEVLLGKGPTATTDQYSLAISYFELRTGGLPFGSESISEVLNAKQHGTIDLDQLPPAEREVIAKAAAIDPAKRFESCVEMVRALRESAFTSDTVSNKHANTVRMSSRRRPRTFQLAGLAIGLLLLAAVTTTVGLAMFGDDPPTPDTEPKAVATRETESLPDDTDVVETTPVVTQPNEEAPPVEVTAPADDPFAESVAQNETPATDEAVAGSEAATTDTVEQTSISPVSEAVAAANLARLADAAEFQQAVNEQIAEATSQTVDNTRQVVEAVQAQQQTAEEIAEATAQTAENTEQIAEATREISLSLETVRRDLAKAKDSLGLIDDPRLPSDFYHNARMYEQRGDYLSARRSYASLLAFHLNVIDPHLQYQRLIRLQDGRAAAREIYADLEPPAEDKATRFAAILASTSTERIAKLEQFVEQHPDYTPAVYYLSVEFSKDKLGAQALADMAKEKQLLNRFQQLVEDGQLVRHFLDQSLAMTWVDDARERRAALQQLDESVFKTPVRMTSMLSNAGWTISLIIPEATREIFYRWADEEQFESTGFNSFVDQRTGRPMPMPSIQLALQSEARKLFVKYVDVRGNEQGPFELAFDPESERVRSGKQILEQLPQAWLSFREFNGRSLAYFSHLVSYRHAIAEIRYGIDTDKPDQVFPLKPVDPHKPHTVSADSLIYITVPPATKFVSVQLKYRDGTGSKLQTFKRTPTAESQAASRDIRDQRQQAANANAAEDGAAAGSSTGQQHRTRQSGNSGRLRDNIGVDVDVDPSFRRAPRVRFGFGF